MVNIGFKSMFKCSVAGVLGVMIPAILLNSLVGLGWIAFMYTLIVWMFGFGTMAVLAVMAFRGRPRFPTRDTKGRFVKA